jgi:uncharacterized protein YgbK (DUF1537 family)
VSYLTVLADDLTGSADSMAVVAEGGAKAMIVTDCLSNFGTHEENGVDVIAVNMSSRTWPGSAARALHEKVSHAIRNFPDQIVLKKMDIGFRGNAAFEIEGIMTALGYEICFVMDSIADMNTFTLYGNQYAMGQLLEKSVYAREDPLKAPKESHIPTILSHDTDLPIASVDIDAVKGPDLSVAVEKVLAKGAKIIVFDAITNEDQDKIVSTLSPLYPKALWSGSIGVIKAMATYLFGRHPKKPEKLSAGLCVGFTASAYQSVKRQLEVARGYGLHIVTLEIDRLVKGDLDALNDASNEMLDANRKGQHAFLQARLSPENEGPGRAQEILNAMTACVKNICIHAGFQRLVIVGGETAASIMKELNINKAVITEKAEVGIGIGIIKEGPYNGKSLALKGGSTGSEAAIAKMLGYIAY